MPAKCTLKSQIEVFFKGCAAYAHTHTRKSTQAVYYIGSVPPPWYTIFWVQGSLLEKFYFFSKQKFHTNNFLFFFSLYASKIFLKFFLFYCKRVQEYVYLQWYWIFYNLF